jgi:hypothetical protein
MDLKTSVAIPYYSNLTSDVLGLDSPEYCFDKNYFSSYPDKIVYNFNELGFRDCSSTQYYGDEILAIGDSFTLGLGVNVDQAWPRLLSKILDYPVRNFSLNGASNDWISRKLTQLLDFFNPKLVVVHYTFSHRRERPFDTWKDHERTESEPIYSQQQNIDNWIKNYQLVNSFAIPVIHSFITDWDPVGVDYNGLGSNVIPPLKKIDLARDSFHYGIKTHAMLAERMADQLTNLLAV